MDFMKRMQDQPKIGVISRAYSPIDDPGLAEVGQGRSSEGTSMESMTGLEGGMVFRL